MKPSFNIMFLALSLLSAGVYSCANSEFSGDSGSNFTKKVPPKKDPPPTGVPPTGGETPPNQPGLTSDGGGTGQLVPKKCNAQTLEGASGAKNCPENYGVFGIDDPTSRVTFGTMACCPLPANDILQGAEVERNGSCGANEILIGNKNGQLTCRAINVAKYKLVPASVCYFGDGASGQGSAPRCSTKGQVPPAFSAISSRIMGSDGCWNFPWGSLSVSQKGRECSDQDAMTLRKADGSAIEMFK